MLDLLPRPVEAALSALLSPVSRAVAWVAYRDARPLCALAYACGWRRWMRIWGREHCARSWAQWTR